MNVNKMSNRSGLGFTLIELMIVVAIIGILAAIAVPQYQTFTRKSRYTEVVGAASPFKAQVEICAQDAGVTPIANCGNGTGGVSAAIATATATITSVNTSAAGVITVVPAVANGIVAADTYVLTPTATVAAGGEMSIAWAASGGCIAKGYCK